MSRIPSLLLATCFAAGAAAQTPDGPYWSAYPIPAGVTSFRLLGSEFVVQTANAVHVYSSILRNWTVLQPVSPTAVLSIMNDYTVVQDGATFHAYSARTGTVQTLVASPNATLDVGSTSSSWVCCVLDGNTVYGYSAFRGQWVPQTLQGSLQHIGVGSHAAAVVDAANAYGFSAFFGTWQSTPVAANGSYTTFRNGCIGQFQSPDEVKAYSAYSNTWASQPWPNAMQAGVNALDGLALLVNGGGTDVLAFGVLHGTLTRNQMAGPVTLLTGPEVAVLQGSAATIGYAPGTDAFVTLPTVPLSGRIQVAGGSFGCYALLDNGSSLAAFSGLTGNVAPLPVYLNYAWSLGDTTALGVGGGLSYAYSALRDQWVLRPGLAPNLVRPTYEAIVAEETGTISAFSARKLTWSTLPTTSNNVAYQQAGALYGVVDTNAVDVFDPVLGRWARVATGPNPVLSVWRLTGVAHDGANAYGYCLFNNTWESVPLSGSVVSFRAQDLVGYVETTTHYYLYSANGSLTNDSRFPEFSRFVVRGAPLHHVQTGVPGSFVFGLFGFENDVEQPMPPYGTLRIDPATASVAALGVVPASGLLDTVIPVPPGPSFHGITLVMQDVVITPQNRILLTNAQLPILW